MGLLLWNAYLIFAPESVPSVEIPYSTFLAQARADNVAKVTLLRSGRDRDVPGGRPIPAACGLQRAGRRIQLADCLLGGGHVVGRRELRPSPT